MLHVAKICSRAALTLFLFFLLFSFFNLLSCFLLSLSMHSTFLFLKKVPIFSHVFFVTRPYVFHVLGAGTHPFRLCPISVKNRHTWKLQKVKVLTLGLFDRSTGFPHGFWAARPYVFPFLRALTLEPKCFVCFKTDAVQHIYNISTRAKYFIVAGALFDETALLTGFIYLSVLSKTLANADACFVCWANWMTMIQFWMKSDLNDSGVLNPPSIRNWRLQSDSPSEQSTSRVSIGSRSLKGQTSKENQLANQFHPRDAGHTKITSLI